jgi:hypothetical protein
VPQVAKLFREFQSILSTDTRAHRLLRPNHGVPLCAHLRGPRDSELKSRSLRPSRTRSKPISPPPPATSCAAPASAMYERTGRAHVGKSMRQRRGGEGRKVRTMWRTPGVPGPLAVTLYMAPLSCSPWAPRLLAGPSPSRSVAGFAAARWSRCGERRQGARACAV